MKKIHDTLKTSNGNSLAYIYDYSSKNSTNLIWLGGLNSDIHGTKAEAISLYCIKDSKTQRPGKTKQPSG